MRVINNVKIRNCDQWLAGFVRRIVKKADINCDVVTIDAFEENLISISVDGDADKHAVILAGSNGYEVDSSGLPCSEKLRWVLTEHVADGYQVILEGVYKVSWTNRFEEHFLGEALKNFAQTAMRVADLEPDRAKIKWCRDNCIAFSIGNADYRITVYSFMPTSYNEDEIPVEFKIAFTLGQVVRGNRNNCDYIEPIIDRRECLLYPTDMNLCEWCGNESEEELFEEAEYINMENYIWVLVQDGEDLEECLWHDLRSDSKKEVTIGDVVQFIDYTGVRKMGNVLSIYGRQGYVHEDEVCVAFQYVG